MDARRRNRWMILVIVLVLGVVAISNRENLSAFLNSDGPPTSQHTSVGAT